MPHKVSSGLLLMVLGVCLAGLSPSAQQPKREKFGSSLDRLKWDEQKKIAVEVRKRKDTGEVAVDEEPIRIRTLLALFDILVTDQQGRYVTGLGRDDFDVTEDGQSQELATFSLGDNEALPRSIVLIIDYSGSQLPYLSNSIEAAKRLVDRLQPKDRMAIVTDDVVLLTDFTQDRERLKKALDSLKKRAVSQATGRSLQYSALLATLRELISSEERPIIIFQTDGDELGSLRSTAPDAAHAEGAVREFGLGDILDVAEKSQTTIYAVIPGVRLIGYSVEDRLKRAKAAFEHELDSLSRIRPMMGEFMRSSLSSMPDEYFRERAEKRLREQLALAGVARITGGWTEFLEDPDEAAAIYTRILLGINRRYIIGYYPANTESGSRRRRVEITVRHHPEYKVLGRKSYIVPE